MVVTVVAASGCGSGLLAFRADQRHARCTAPLHFTAPFRPASRAVSAEEIAAAKGHVATARKRKQLVSVRSFVPSFCCLGPWIGFSGLLACQSVGFTICYTSEHALVTHELGPTCDNAFDGGLCARHSSLRCFRTRCSLPPARVATPTRMFRYVMRPPHPCVWSCLKAKCTDAPRHT